MADSKSVDFRQSRVFISHATTDAALAQQLKKCLIATLGLNDAEVFCASDKESIRHGEKWRDAIVDALHTSRAFVILLTPRSLFRPWLSFEAGAAIAGDRVLENSGGVFPMLGGGLDRRAVPSS